MYYLSTTDVLVIILALTVSITLIITTTIANAKLTMSRDYWRSECRDSAISADYWQDKYLKEIGE